MILIVCKEPIKLKLCLSCFFFCLGLNISANHFFIDSYGRDKIAFAPDTFLIPIDFFQEIEFSAQRSIGILLDSLCYHTYRIFGRNHHIQMNMIWFDSYLDIFPVRIIFSYFLEFYLQIAFHSRDQYFPPVAVIRGIPRWINCLST